MAVLTNHYAWSMSEQGDSPWTTAFYALLNEVDATMLDHVPLAGKTQTWGVKGFGEHYLQATRNTAILYFGTHNRQNLPFTNLQIENVVALPAVGASVAGKVVHFQEKLWVCVDPAVPTYYPLTRPYLVVQPGADLQNAEYTSIATALAALPASGGTVLLMPGTYTLANALAPPNNCQIIGLGDNVIVDYAAVVEAYGLLLTDRTDVYIENVRFNGGAAKNGIRMISTADALTARITVKRCIFTEGVNAIEALQSGGAGFGVDDVRVQDCQFVGTAIAESAIYCETKPRRWWIDGCDFTGWGRVASQHTIDINSTGVAGSRWLQIHDCTMRSNGVVAGTAERDISILNVDDVLISGVHSDAMGGTGIRIEDANDILIQNCVIDAPTLDGIYLDDCIEFLVQGCAVDTPAGDGIETAGTLNQGCMTGVYVTAATGVGFKLNQLDDSMVTGCGSRGATSDGFDVQNCDRTTFSGCYSDGSGGHGYDVATSTYLVFQGCTGRGSTGNDLNAAVTMTNSRLNFTLSKVPGGTYAASNGIQRSLPIPIGAFTSVSGAGTPGLVEYTTTNRVGWVFDGAADEAIAGSWVVPEKVLPGSDIDVRLLYVGETAPGAGDNTAAFTLNVLSENPGVTLITDAGVNVAITAQAITAAHRIMRADKLAVTSAAWGAAERNLLLTLTRNATLGVGVDDYAHDLHVVGLEAEVVLTEIEVRA